MATLTLSTIRNLVRSDLNERSTTSLTNTELNAIINDGYKDVAAKALCYENKLTKSNIPVSVRMIPLASDNVIKVNYVEYDLGTSCLGLMEILPTALGHVPIDGYTPQFWFQWGDYLVIEPLPDAGTYDLFVYASCYPSAVMSSDSATPSDLPIEFHEDVYFFAKAFANLKLKRWADFAVAYNAYITDIQIKKAKYITKYPDTRALHTLPQNVEIKSGREAT